MPEGALNLTLSEENTARLAEEAKAAGLSPEALATELLSHLLDDPFATARPTTTPADYDGPCIGLNEALSEFDAELDRRLAARDA